MLHNIQVKSVCKIKDTKIEKDIRNKLEKMFSNYYYYLSSFIL